MYRYALTPRKGKYRWLVASQFIATLIFTIPQPTSAAEYGTGPWLKGYSDIFAGVLPSAPGFYFRGDAYHYNASAGMVIFDGRVSLNVDQDMTASVFALTYVTPWKILGGTYALAAAPSVVTTDVDIGIGLPPSRDRAAGRSMLLR